MNDDDTGLYIICIRRTDRKSLIERNHRALVLGGSRNRQRGCVEPMKQSNHCSKPLRIVGIHYGVLVIENFLISLRNFSGDSSPAADCR